MRVFLSALACRLVLLALLGAGGLAPALAEDLRYPHLERLFRQPAAPAAPQRATTQRKPQERSVARAAPRHQLPESTVPPTYFVAVLGDAMALMLADGLKESLALERPHVGFLRKGRDASGVVRDDYFDWRKAARELAQGTERVDYVLIMMGANDRQPMRDADGTSLEPFSPRWKEIYGQRVEEIVAPLRARGLPVAWVGLPIMKADRYGADIMALNEILRAHAEKAGASFVDTWERFADEAGQFSIVGPDVVGRPVRLRTADGIHFTQAGSVKLAHFVQGDIARLAGAAPVVAPPTAPLAETPSVPLAAQPEVEAPTAPAPDGSVVTAMVSAAARREEESKRFANLLPGVPPPEEPAPLFFPMKPAIGPVTALTGPPLAPDGLLAAGPAPLDAASLRERALVEGRAVDPRPGRADDFSWPKR